MIQLDCPVHGVEQVAENVFVLSFLSPAISHHTAPGQFVNIKVDQYIEPLLRRPFSIYRTSGEHAEIIFNVVGKGSTLLRKKKKGDTINVLGPLGVPFSLSRDDFDTAVLVGGGLGVAPLPLATQYLSAAGKRVQTFLGARSANQLVEAHLLNVRVATDDGTKGHHGTVVDLLTSQLSSFTGGRAKIFACGPTKMLHALAEMAIRARIPCEVSLEGPMACGFGICQGCPVELVNGGKKYALMCKDGPTFDVNKIKI